MRLSTALLTALITAFTNYLTIDEYCDAFYDDGNKMTETTLVSIDVAHFIKNWSKFLFNRSKRIKVFYMACIGQLILSQNIEQAADIIKKLFIITQTETNGKNVKNNRTTSCEKAINALKSLVTADLKSYEVLCKEDRDSTSSESDDDKSEDENVAANVFQTEKQNKEKDTLTPKWKKWAENLKEEMRLLVTKEEGDHENAYFDPAVAEHLVDEYKRISMWSCIFKNKFGNDKTNPSSSASVESEIRKVKRGVLTNEVKKKQS